MSADPHIGVLGGDLYLPVWLQPGASKDAIKNWVMRDDGSKVLRVSVRAVADKGKANKALCNLVARTWGLPKSSVSIKSGGKSRHKVLHLADAAGLRAEIEQLGGQE